MIGINLLSKFNVESCANRPLHIIELGPGRGTLMNDILRTFSSFPHFFQRLKKCSFVELSPYLKIIQSETMNKWSNGIDINWVDEISGVNIEDNEVPIIIAQEFFDAIPIHVFKRRHNEWKELKVSSKMNLVEESSRYSDLFRLSQNFPNYPVDQTIELSPMSWSICQQIKKIIDKCKTAEGIIIDYGHFRPSKNSLRVGIICIILCSYVLGDSQA
jgi:NADH dehydrogenase [ubiquinone] 1 alpha subcomplex assembly factor 7